ncbi:MAG TPA: hypothetical protein VNA69_04270, partial [Thermoanaerobaculia bacterium]|nr:hypothetical protein [Thermoanaerobaculia bacterium]
MSNISSKEHQVPLNRAVRKNTVPAISRRLLIASVAISIGLAFVAPPTFAVEPPSLSSFEWLGFTNSGVSMLRLAGTFPGTTAHQDRKVFLDLD